MTRKTPTSAAGTPRSPLRGAWLLTWAAYLALGLLVLPPGTGGGRSVLAAPAPGARGTAPPDPPPAIWVRVTTTTGAPVAGLTVQLAPAPAALGGPAGGPPARVVPTDAAGIARFAAPGPGIWRVTFAGTYQGRPLAAPRAQGRPPAGAVRAGGGFPLQVEPQEEGAPPPAAGPPVLWAAFVLQPAGAVWRPAYDLGPLPTPAGAPTGASAPAPDAAGPPAPPPRTWLLELGGALLLAAAAGGWWRRRTAVPPARPEEST